MALACCAPAAVGGSAASTMPTPQTYLSIAEQTQASLRHDVLDKWFPAAVDLQRGGFDETFGEDWSALDGAARSIVYQSRLTWLAARAAAIEPERAVEFLTYTRHGVKFLAEKQWDRQHGGLFWSVNRGGEPNGSDGAAKHAYGMAFAIYAAAASFEVTHDPAALELAKKTFLWLDQHAHDADHGGYFEALSREGTPILSGNGNDSIGTRLGRKSMNTHIHLLEAFTQLHKVWPDESVRRRLREVFDVCLHKVYTDPGYLTMFFTPDWKAVQGRDSFGHDVETAFLLVDASEELEHTAGDDVWRAGRRLVDHALHYGFDRQNGGFYDEGTPNGDDLETEKIWWTQAEGLNALLLMHERFGSQTSEYWDAFVQEWDFIRRHQIDSIHGGWYSTVNADGSARQGLLKSDLWTEGYHQGRALMNVTARLRHLAGN
jgi:mannobiose 2-epimerase